MVRRRSRAVWAALTAAVLVVGGAVAPAVADDPPAWTAIPGTAAVIDGLTIGLEEAPRATNPWGISSPDAPAVPYIRPVAVNGSAETRYLGFGMDIRTQGTIDQLWDPDSWGSIFGEPPESGFVESFFLALEPGQTLEDMSTLLSDGVPQWTGRTFVMYEMSGPFETDPTATQIATFTESHRFVPAHLDQTSAQNVPVIGQPLEVTGTGAASDLFPGVTATVEGTGLTAGETLELWLIPDYDFFFLHLAGGALPTTGVYLGSGTVAGDGTFRAPFTVPSATAIGDRYQLAAGVPAERYWPAGSHRDFSITEPDAAASVATPTDGTPTTIEFEVTDVTMTFPAGTPAGTVTAAVTATGPINGEFVFASNPPLFYHLDTTSTLSDQVEVCVTYDTAAIPGSPPNLYHYVEDPPGTYRWIDITSRTAAGEVCGLTSSFSPFTLGFPPHDGSTKPPAKGVLSSDNGQDTGLHDGSYNVTMNLWSGENARIVRLLENGTVVAELRLTRNTPKAQKAVFPITGKPNGTYLYTAQLENSTGVTTTKALTVKVKDASPGKVVLSATSPKNGAFTLTANMWWGTNATSAQFYQNGVAVGAPIALTASTPNAQTATMPLVRPKGDYTYKVVFSNAAGSTSSTDLRVKVK